MGDAVKKAREAHDAQVQLTVGVLERVLSPSAELPNQKQPPTIYKLRGPEVGNARRVLEKLTIRDKIRFEDHPAEYAVTLIRGIQVAINHIESAEKNGSKRTKAEMPAVAEELRDARETLIDAVNGIENARDGEKLEVAERFPQNGDRRKEIEQWGQIVVFVADLWDNLRAPGHPEFQWAADEVTREDVAKCLHDLQAVRGDIHIAPIETLIREGRFPKAWMALYDLTDEFKEGKLEK